MPNEAMCLSTWPLTLQTHTEFHASLGIETWEASLSSASLLVLTWLFGGLPGFPACPQSEHQSRATIPLPKIHMETTKELALIEGKWSKSGP